MTRRDARVHNVDGHDLVLMHMARHLLLGAVLPPLVWLIAPSFLPAFRLPRRAHAVLSPVGRALTHPVTTWLAGTLTIVAWHIPAAFELAQRSAAWHRVQDVSFVATGLLFWWPVVQPWTAAKRVATAMVPLYLFTATLPCDALSAFLVFSDRVVYHPHLVDPTRAAAALADQQAAGAFMWVAITFLYLVPAFVSTVHAVSRAPSDWPPRRRLPTP